MSGRIRLFQVDAFTTQRFTGNPAGVVLDAQLLSDAQMQSLARELGNGDTAFVLPPDDAHHDLRIRFFTPRKEAAFVGHATLAAHAVLQRLESRPFRLQQGQTGTVEVAALPTGGLGIRQPPPAMGRPLAAEELEKVLALTGIRPAQLDPACPAQIIGSASTRLLLGVANSAVLDSLQPQQAALGELSAALGAQGYFLFTRHPSAPDCDTEARMFCPAIGIDEDPVSGNAHAMLGAYLVGHGLIDASGAEVSFEGVQGRHVGRPGRVSVSMQLDAGAVKSTRISGHAVIVFQSVLDL
ncbi:MAG: PhzF family phenazine biosynthesis isomerase [Pseudomonadota bacterium]